jgi:hypothetical protein
MKRASYIAAAATVFVASVISSALAQTNAGSIEPAGARAFVDQVIAYEVRSDTTMRDKAFLAFFTPRFRSAIEKDMAGPELNVIDSDFLCQCQTGVVKMDILGIASSENTAVVSIESWSVGENPPVKLKWHLWREGQAWRISDVETSQRSSLLTELERSNRLH